MKKRGRPPIGGKRMGDGLRIRLASDEHELLDRAASLSGLPTARWARTVLLDHARKATEQAKPESK
jgi:hypothetical protein